MCFQPFFFTFVVCGDKNALYKKYCSAEECTPKCCLFMIFCSSLPNVETSWGPWQFTFVHVRASKPHMLPSNYTLDIHYIIFHITSWKIWLFTM